MLHREVFNRRYRGRQAGRAVQAGRPSPRLRSLGNGAFVVVGNRPTRARVDKHSPPCVVSISVPRCAEAVSRAVRFGGMNVRSLSPSKIDNLLVEFRDRHLDVLLLCETWHDADSVSTRRLRADGFTLVERDLGRDQVSPRRRSVSTTAALPSLLPPASEHQPSISAYNRRRLNALLRASRLLRRAASSSSTDRVQRPWPPTFSLNLRTCWTVCRRSSTRLCSPEI